tara:strand:- start:340 stop:645 length:306 start_codon:yes stop_codon:yes gene_type:complete
MATSKNFAIYEGHDYEVRLEYNREYMIVHLPEVFKFNKTTLISMLMKLDEINDFSVGLGYPALHCAAPRGDIKINKLARRCGFTQTGEDAAYLIYQYTGVQ